jgi:hypothetical protein
VSAPDDVGGLPAIYGALADPIRRLIDISIRTEVDTRIVATAKSQIDSAAAQLSALMTPRSFGIRQTDDGQNMAWGNVLIGIRNPVAPPVVISHLRLLTMADGIGLPSFALVLPGYADVSLRFSARFSTNR